MFSFCFLKDLSRDIYDLYAEYEREELEDRLPVSPSRVLLSPNKHSTLNINVGGTVRLFNTWVLTRSSIKIMSCFDLIIWGDVKLLVDGLRNHISVIKKFNYPRDMVESKI